MYKTLEIQKIDSQPQLVSRILAIGLHLIIPLLGAPMVGSDPSGLEDEQVKWETHGDHRDFLVDLVVFCLQDVHGCPILIIKRVGEICVQVNQGHLSNVMVLVGILA